MAEERRHQVEEKTYAVFSAHSVNTMAESSGHSPLGGEAATSLGEDASYRLRQVVALAGQYIKHNKRRRLCGDDFNKAAKDMNVMPTYGHSSQEPTTFRHVKEAQIHSVEDPEVNLADIALGDYVPRNLGKPSIKAHWLIVEGVMKSAAPAGTSQASKAGKEMSANHLKYYNCLTQALLGKDVNSKKKALRDLRSNPNIVPVLPYVVNFVVSGIKNMSHDMEHLTTMLNTVRALLHNRSLYLMHKPYLSTIMLGVETCVLEPLAASINSANDHWLLRDHAARLLAEIVNRWNSPHNHLRFNITKKIKEVFQDAKRPFYSHYGAVMALIALGHKAIEDVILPHLPVYWARLKSVMEDNSAENIINKYDSHKVYGALRLAAEKLMRRSLKNFEEDMTKQTDRKDLEELLDVNDNTTADVFPKEKSHTPVGRIPEVQKTWATYQILQELFGDSLTDCLPLPDTRKLFKATKEEGVVSLGDHNSGKSGEELLENLMEQIHMQEKLDQERKERELREQKEREKLERERRAREAKERQLREEQERVLKRRREEEEHKRKRLEMEEAERQKRLKEEADKRQREWAEQLKEINKNRSKPQWQQEIELRRQQLEEEMQYSRMMEAQKRKDETRGREKEKPKQFWSGSGGGGEEEMDDKALEDSNISERGKKRLRRRKPVNYTEKDEDISDLIDESTAKVARSYLTPRQHFALPSHSDISDDSDPDESESRRMAMAGLSPASGSGGDSLSLSSTMVNPSKGILKLKIKRQATHSASPPYPVLNTPQHSSPMYQSPSMLSPRHPSHPSPLSISHSSSPAGLQQPQQQQQQQPPLLPQLQQYPRSKGSSSGSDKESKHKKSGSTSSSGGNNPKPSRPASTSNSGTGLMDNWDTEELFYERPQSNLPPQLYSPGGESSGSDSNPHRKALKLKLKLTPNHPPSE